MKNPNPFDKALDQISDLLASIQEKKGGPFKEKLPKDIDAQLDALEYQVGLLAAMTDETLEAHQIDQQELKRVAENPEEAPKLKEKRLLKRAKELKKEVGQIDSELARQKTVAKMRKKKAKTTGKHRKKKFRNLGGGDWLPL